MRDPARIDPILDALRDYWKASPDLRLCQLIENLIAQEQPGHCIYAVEDDVLLDKLKGASNYAD